MTQLNYHYASRHVCELSVREITGKFAVGTFDRFDQIPFSGWPQKFFLHTKTARSLSLLLWWIIRFQKYISISFQCVCLVIRRITGRFESIPSAMCVSNSSCSRIVFVRRNVSRISIDISQLLLLLLLVSIFAISRRGVIDIVSSCETFNNNPGANILLKYIIRA